MIDLNIETAKEIYKNDYYDRFNINKIKNDKVALSIFDWLVNSGKWATKKAQQVLNNITNNQLVVDGILGDKSIEAINKVDVDLFLTAYHNIQREFYNAIVKNKPSQKVFLRGWLNRVDKKEKFIKEMEV